MVSLTTKNKKKKNNNNTNLRFTHNYAELKDLRERKATQPLIKCAHKTTKAADSTTTKTMLFK